MGFKHFQGWLFNKNIEQIKIVNKELALAWKH
jgi:hypothetical protein